MENDVIEPPMLERDSRKAPSALRPSNTFTLSQHACVLAYVSVKVITLPAGATKVVGAHDQLLP